MHTPRRLAEQHAQRLVCKTARSFIGLLDAQMAPGDLPRVISTRSPHSSSLTEHRLNNQLPTERP